MTLAPHVRPTPAGRIEDRARVVARLEQLDRTLKAQQALVRSCLPAEPDPDLADQLEVLLRALTGVRRQQRALLRLWRSLPPDVAAPGDLVAETDLLVDSHLALEAPLRRCRRATMDRARRDSVEVWREIASVAERRLAGGPAGPLAP